ncbi:hypothetical protein [Sphaerisporangium sp. TRM90804]|uniref:hypothetical protein n=1 Tax=Sphaerisporangium sp. TRM90804 TaxID=3031113 RepID=UPI00244C386B|nr:hypothetical protein [Sphaerisporangium sp. TRM90804]MDH2428582.1 hypothetical protein [Sphaerisporangium sp. TRM90804]
MRHLRDFALTVVVLAVLGAAAGLLWSALAPRTAYLVTEGGPQLADPTTQSLIAADGWFACVTAVAGLACGVVGYLVARNRRPVALLAGLAVGGLAAGGLTLAVGTSLNASTVQAAAPGTAGVGTTVNVLAVTAYGVLLSWPLVAVAVFGIMESVEGYRESPLRTPYGGAPPLPPPGSPSFGPSSFGPSSGPPPPSGPPSPLPPPPERR